MVTKKFYWNWKKLPNGIRPFGFFILMPPLEELEKFVDQVLPPLPEPRQEPVIASGELSPEEQKERAIKRHLAKLRLKNNETSDKLIPA